MSLVAKKRSSTTPGYLEVVLIALVVAGLTLFAFDRWFVPRVVALTRRATLAQQALLASGEITEAQWQQRAGPAGAGVSGSSRPTARSSSRRWC